MPLYEYECFVCHHHFERIQKVDAVPIGVCPSCGGSVRRLLGVPALQFKGSGWYVTDYGKSGSAGTDRSTDTPSSASTSPPASTSSTGNGASATKAGSTSSADTKAS